MNRTKPHKTKILRFRIGTENKEKFMSLCESKGETPSAKLRNFVLDEIKG